MPMLAGLQRWIVNFFLKDQEFTHTVDAGPAKGVNFPIKLPDDKGIWTGTYEQKFTQKIASLINEGDVCCDVGGWHGFVGAVMAVQGASEVHIFDHPHKSLIIIHFTIFSSNRHPSTRST